METWDGARNAAVGPLFKINRSNRGGKGGEGGGLHIQDDIKI